MSVTFAVANTPVDYDDDRTYVNVSNGRAYELLVALGLPLADEHDEHLVGTVDAVDLLGRILLARALVDDTGSDTLRVGGDGHATLVDVGRPAGYFAHRLAALEALAERAILAGEVVAWS